MKLRRLAVFDILDRQNATEFAPDSIVEFRDDKGNRIEVTLRGGVLNVRGTNCTLAIEPQAANSVNVEGRR